MSGLYLIVWEDASRLLQPTKGGYPHITVAYTGKQLCVEELKDAAKEIFDEAVMKPVTLTNAYVNSFTVEKTGQERHDVLLSVDNEALIKKLRGLLKKRFPLQHSKFFMRDPHVTANICDTREKADAYLQAITKKLPIPVTITGITID